MQSRQQACVWWLVLSLAVVMLGCRSEEPPRTEEDLATTSESESASDDLAAQLSRSDREEDDSSAEEMSTEDESTASKPTPPPAPKKIPDVVMTKALAATCLVKVGEPFPDGDLTDLDGQAQSLQVLWGTKLTVLVFWNSDNPYAQQELQDLQLDIADPFGPQGVQVVGINVKDPLEKVREKLGKAGATFPQLRDGEGAFFAKVATEKLPRTYLLDAEGKILWFDLEYSTATRRNLLQAIQVVLAAGT